MEKMPNPGNEPSAESLKELQMMARRNKVVAEVPTIEVKKPSRAERRAKKQKNTPVLAGHAGEGEFSPDADALTMLAELERPAPEEEDKETIVKNATPLEKTLEETHPTSSDPTLQDSPAPLLKEVGKVLETNKGEPAKIEAAPTRVKKTVYSSRKSKTTLTFKPGQSLKKTALAASRSDEGLGELSKPELKEEETPPVREISRKRRSRIQNEPRASTAVDSSPQNEYTETASSGGEGLTADIVFSPNPSSKPLKTAYEVAIENNDAWRKGRDEKTEEKKEGKEVPRTKKEKIEKRTPRGEGKKRLETLSSQERIGLAISPEELLPIIDDIGEFEENGKKYTPEAVKGEILASIYRPQTGRLIDLPASFNIRQKVGELIRQGVGLMESLHDTTAEHIADQVIEMEAGEEHLWKMEPKIPQAYSFAELYGYLEGFGTIKVQHGENFVEYSPDRIKDIVEALREGAEGVFLEDLPEEGGLRAKVGELLKKEKLLQELKETQKKGSQTNVEKKVEKEEPKVVVQVPKAPQKSWKIPLLQRIAVYGSIVAGFFGLGASSGPGLKGAPKRPPAMTETVSVPSKNVQHVEIGGKKISIIGEQAPVKKTMADNPDTIQFGSKGMEIKRSTPSSPEATPSSTTKPAETNMKKIPVTSERVEVKTGPTVPQAPTIEVSSNYFPNPQTTITNLKKEGVKVVPQQESFGKEILKTIKGNKFPERVAGEPTVLQDLNRALISDDAENARRIRERNPDYPYKRVDTPRSTNRSNR